MQVPTRSSIGDLLRTLSDYFRSPKEPDRTLAMGKKIEVVYAIVSKGIPLFRTEGVGDVNLFPLKISKCIVSVPVILPEKIQAKLRRQMLEILRAHFDDTVKKLLLEKYKANNYKKLKDDEPWKCYIAPPLGNRETDIGMCGFCPVCNIMGTIITRSELGVETSRGIKPITTTYGLKSRVAHDSAYALVEERKAIVDMSHTKVGEGISYTGRALFEESHVLPGVVFVGKIVLCDVTELEAKLVLAGLSNIRRMGAGETKYGAVQTIILGMKGGMTETISSYDIARRVLDSFSKKDIEGLLDPETYLKEVLAYLEKKNFYKVIDLKEEKVDEIGVQVSMTKEEINSLWEIDNYYYAKDVIKYIKKVELG